MVDIDAPMFLDVTEDLQRVDGVMTRLVKDRTLWQEFLDDPNGVMLQINDDLNVCVGYPMCATSAVVPLIIGFLRWHYVLRSRLLPGNLYVRGGFSFMCVVGEF